MRLDVSRIYCNDMRSNKGTIKCIDRVDLEGELFKQLFNVQVMLDDKVANKYRYLSERSERVERLRYGIESTYRKKNHIVFRVNQLQ